MYRKYVLLMACSCLVASSAFAQGFGEPQANTVERIDASQLNAGALPEPQTTVGGNVDAPQLNAGEVPEGNCCGWKDESGAAPSISGPMSEMDAVRQRFINPHPELGCMYYDVNNVRHWFPRCHGS